MSPDQENIRVTFQVPHLPSAIRILLGALTAVNVNWLRTHPDTPSLYQANVIYQREPSGHEEWRAIPQVIADGFGDCEDLACWRAAELFVKGHKAHAFSSFRERTDANGKTHRLYHIRVRTAVPDSRAPKGYRIVIEDPSRKLGMGDDSIDLRGPPVEFAV